MTDPNSADTPSPRWTLPLLACSTLWILASLVLMRLEWLAPGSDPARGVQYELAAGIPLLIWAGLLWSGRAGALTGRERTALVCGAILLRFILIDLAPVQSDDVYRYLWEGRVQRAGFNPYRLAPEAPELTDLRNADWERINHPEYSAIYPPLAQTVFLLGAAIHPSIPMMKILFMLCDLGVLFTLLRWLARRGLGPAWAALWAFHPLVIVEFSGNGHLDSLMALMLVLSLMWLEEGREVPAVAALAAAVASKLIPLLILPYFFWRMKRRWLLLGVPLIVAAAYLPYASAGKGVVASLWIYQRDWLYNAPVFEWARDALFHADGFLARKWFYGALGLLALAMWMGRAEPAAAWLGVAGFYQLAGPVVHPWYLAAFLPAVCVRRGAWPWIGLTVLAPMIYWKEDSSMIKTVIWWPFYLALALEGTIILGRWSWNFCRKFQRNE